VTLCISLHPAEEELSELVASSFLRSGNVAPGKLALAYSEPLHSAQRHVRLDAQHCICRRPSSQSRGAPTPR
jgi:hypothetical protein